MATSMMGMGMMAAAAVLVPFLLIQQQQSLQQFSSLQLNQQQSLLRAAVDAVEGVVDAEEGAARTTTRATAR